MKHLNTRLDALETQAGADGELSGLSKTLLVGILGRRDALFWPWRFSPHSCPPFPEIRQRQREYLAGTSGVSARADGRSQWKSAHEIRQRLAAAGMLRAVGANGETVSVILTSRGEAVARALVGDRLFTVERARAWRVMLQILTEAHGAPIRESVLFGHPCTGSPTDWESHVEPMLPLLAAGLVVADSDTVGRALFTLVDGVELPEAVAVDVQPEDGFDEIYLVAFNNERAVLAAAEPRDPSEIYLPIGASSHWPAPGVTTDEK